MSAHDLQRSLERAEQRFGQRKPARRADAGRGRLEPALAEHLRALLLTHERPRVAEIRRTLEAEGKAQGWVPPSRAQIYRFMARCEGHRYQPRRLPPSVQAALYNLDLEGEVPGAQLAFYLFHHGDLAALSFAAGLPWLDLYQAARVRGWRPRTRGLLDAVLRGRRIA